MPGFHCFLWPFPINLQVDLKGYVGDATAASGSSPYPIRLPPGASIDYTVTLTPEHETEGEQGMITYMQRVDCPDCSPGKRPKAHKMQVPVTYLAMEGSLAVPEGSLSFTAAFPGATVEKYLVIRNKYHRDLQITGVASVDPRFIPVVNVHKLPAQQETVVGVVQFQPVCVLLFAQFLSPT